MADRNNNPTQAEVKARAEAKARAEVEARTKARQEEKLAALRKAAREMPKNGRARYDFRYGLECAFVSGSGKRYQAAMLPLPVNKGDLIEVPAITDPIAEMAKIQKLPVQDRVKAFQRFNAAMAKAEKGMLLNGEVRRLAEYKGVLMNAQQVADRWYPVCDLMVNFSDNPDRENWELRVNVRAKEHVPVQLDGHTVPHFEFV